MRIQHKRLFTFGIVSLILAAIFGFLAFSNLDYNYKHKGVSYFTSDELSLFNQSVKEHIILKDYPITIEIISHSDEECLIVYEFNANAPIDGCDNTKIPSPETVPMIIFIIVGAIGIVFTTGSFFKD